MSLIAVTREEGGLVFLAPIFFWYNHFIGSVNVFGSNDFSEVNIFQDKKYHPKFCFDLKTQILIIGPSFLLIQEIFLEKNTFGSKMLGPDSLIPGLYSGIYAMPQVIDINIVEFTHMIKHKLSRVHRRF